MKTNNLDTSQQHHYYPIIGTLAHYLNMKTIKTLFILLFFLSINNVWAVEHIPYAKIEQMHARKWRYLIEQSKLQQKEGDLIQAFFNEYEKAIWELHEQKGSFFSNIKQTNTTEINYSQLNDQYIEIQLKEAKLLKTYHSQLKKNLKPETLFNYYQAEREFKKQLLHGMRGDRRPNNCPQKQK